MRQFNLGKYRMARVWINDLPDTICSTISTSWITVTAKKLSIPSKVIAVEFLIPLGPRSMYGLLGGAFSASPTSTLRIAVPNTTIGGTYVSSLCGTSDCIERGFPIEYTDAIKEGAHMVKNEEEIAQGELVISHAAYSEKSTCYIIYKHLAATLVKLASLEICNPTDAKIQSLFPENFSNVAE